MKNITPVLGLVLFGCLALVSCKSEAEPKADAEQKPLTLQDLSIDPAFEKAAAENSETIAEAQKTKDEINEKIKASEENAKKLNDILGGK